MREKEGRQEERKGGREWGVCREGEVKELRNREEGRRKNYSFLKLYSDIFLNLSFCKKHEQNNNAFYLFLGVIFIRLLT